LVAWPLNISALRGHVPNSHESASFAFKQARRAVSIAASCTPENSRSALFAREDFYAEFAKHRAVLQASEGGFKWF